MRDKLQKIRAYIFRGWEDKTGYTHPGLKILPPFLLELIAYFVLGSIILRFISYLWSLF